MVEPGPDRDPLGELRGAAHMVGVEVGDDHVVECGHAGVSRRRRDSVGIAPVEAGPSGVDQQGIAGRPDEERRLAPLDVDHVDLQRPVRLPLPRRRGRRNRESDRQHPGRAHAISSVCPTV